VRSIFAVLLAVLAVFVYGGCKKASASGPTTAEIKAFDAATPEVKQAWQAALDADRTNDYVKGLSLCSSLLGETLPPEQRNAVARLSTSLKQRMSDAADKGDAAAQAAVQELRQSSRNRQR
jgi:hypothetical protein